MPRTADSIQTELTAVDTAITAALQAQSYTVGGRSKTNADLKALTARRDELQQQLDRANGASPMFVRGVVRGLGRR